MSENVDANESLGGRVRREGLEFARFILGAALVYLVITTVIFRTFYIPSSSMVPTLEVRDRVIVLNFAYGWSRHSLPFGVGDLLPEGDGRIFGRMPGRGDVVVFRHPNGGEHLIKRVIGLPGDHIRVRDGQLAICEAGSDCDASDAFTPVQRELIDIVRYRDYEGVVRSVYRYEETLPNGRSHAMYERSDDSRFDNTCTFQVPDGAIFVMGDNRDASNDSRSDDANCLEEDFRSPASRPGTLGFVPVENLVGRAVTVLFTFKSCRRETGLRCPTGRVWRPL